MSTWAATRHTSPASTPVAVLSATARERGPQVPRAREDHTKSERDSDNDDKIDQDVERLHVSVVADYRKDQAGKGDTEKS